MAALAAVPVHVDLVGAPVVFGLFAREPLRLGG